ncbi:protein kinase domain-containing protein [Citrus sinensis]|uniref:Protein kinase domain-containing protein n=1 Tax=Citrus sinensis TaxID=2711 RepID=A0ACB8KTE3_CITSI|nr:protein kinase domain-containing protein [Citrus sinensis]
MGCVQAKSSMNSPHGGGGLYKLKMENGYVGNKALMGHRRSTGQRYNGKETGRFQKLELPVNYDDFENGGEEKVSGEQRVRDNGTGSGKSGGGVDGELVNGWPKWLTDNIPREVLAGLVPKSAESYDKIDKVGQGTYSNVYKALDRDTGKIVALKKVKFDTSEPESVKFMAREIMILQKLDHPNVVKLEGLATSRMQYSLYLVFEFMPTDLARIISNHEGKLTEPQVKCYMQQLLSGLQHCHDRGILHRDVKGSNLLIDKNGVLKIADFGLANYFSPNKKRPLTSRVVTLWYRAPELLLGATNYGVGIDLWSAGCLLAEMFSGRPIMPARTEVEQLHRIFKLCGSPSEDYWKKLRLSTTFRPPQSYKPCLFEAFSEFPESSLGLLSTLLALDPAYRGSAASALKNEFFFTSPLACDLSGLPVIYDKEDELIEANQQRKQDSEKPVELNFQGQEPYSSASSASSGTKTNQQSHSPPFMLFPVAASHHQKMSPRNKGHPNGTKNIKNQPPLPNSKTRPTTHNEDSGNMYRLNRVSRSASTREFRKLYQNKQLESIYA